eukprot:gnl/TRDRNA2_/TRDRNA2_177186_c1_seq2.p1 gnl/TRDRNA2_/TRDRNA2_177186_c1~~gnl/TRDRNA2_/TRDRNA2_177186_c1_seq2.p1  ORF type:complete len:469 (+),score=67.60 gnl/TRDRNA2_/TRDRNA2_177186_c1_seq2:76-1482(+)
MLFHGPSRTYLYDIFAALRPRLPVRAPDEPRRRLPELVPTHFVFAAATLVHIGPFSVGNMLIERFCTARTFQTRHFHRLPPGIGMDNVRWLEGSDDWDRRVEQLLDTIRATPCERTLVFVNSLHNCHVLLGYFRDKGWPVVGFMKGPAGKMGPRFRDAEKFVNGDANIMIATEFGGRGIDWHEVDHVINFQMATSTICWLHRIGRTGRMGKPGLVTNFVGSKDVMLADQIKTRLLQGKDLHGAFSRKKSLKRKVRMLAGGADVETGPQPEDGVYKLDGGLELFEGQLKAEDATSGAAGGTIIGYLSAEELNQHSVDGGGHRARGTRQAADDLGEYRRQLLESDSEDEDDGDPSGGEEDDDEERRPQAWRRDTGPLAVGADEREFSWSMLNEADEDAVIGPPARRRLLDRSGRDGRSDEDAAGREKRHGRRRPDRSQQHAGARKGFGVQSASRAAAARNYASPDDELLL